MDVKVKNSEINIAESNPVVVAMSGGVDSSVAAVLVHRAIGDRLTCIFVDHGLLRKQEREDNEQQRLAIENKRRKAKGMELLTELKSSDKKKEDDKAKEGEEKESKDKEEDDKEPDALLLETGKILTDLMELNNIPATKTQQVKHQQ